MHDLPAGVLIARHDAPRPVLLLSLPGLQGDVLAAQHGSRLCELCAGRCSSFVIDQLVRENSPHLLTTSVVQRGGKR